MFEAKGVDFAAIPPEEEVPLNEGTGAGRGFAVTGGVAGAVVEAIGRLEPGREVKVVSAEGLQECKKMLMLAKAGKYDGYLLEGMACPGGCVAVGKYSKAADKQNALDSDYEMDLPMLD